MTGDTIAQALQHACQAGLARIDAQLLMLHVLGRAPQDRAWLLAHDTDTLPALAAEKFATLCVHRQNGEPVAYLTGRKAFFGLDLAVDARVLDPRPDTETLVEWALALPGLPASARVIDLGTGSGAIALALKSQRPAWQLHAVDTSADALEVAHANAQRLGLAVNFLHGNWLDPWGDAQQTHLDLIVSNPPYVASADPHLAALRHEPLQALASGPDGLDDIRTLVAQAPAHLAPGGWLLLEHGHDQADAVRQLLAQAGFTAVTSRQDLAGVDRCSGGQWRKL